jgi:hypothetical protein
MFCRCNELNFRHAMYPNLANVDVIANMCDTDGRMGPAQTATASVSNEQTAINFNGKKFLSWRDARDEYTRVFNRGSSQMWARVKPVGEDETKPFQLRYTYTQTFSAIYTSGSSLAYDFILLYWQFVPCMKM